MKITIAMTGKYIGNGKGAKAPVKTYRNSPAVFDYAAKAAAHYAKRDNQDYVITWGSRNGYGLWEICTPDRLHRLPRLTGEYPAAVAKPNGDILGAVVTWVAVRKTLTEE